MTIICKGNNMTTRIELKLSFTGAAQDAILEIAPDADINDVIEIIKARALVILQEGQQLFLFVENAEEPLPYDGRLDKLSVHHGYRVHAHHCRHIDVTVEDGGVTKTRAFSPASAVGSVKRWAVEAFCHSADAFALELKGENGHLSDGEHIGVFAHNCDLCLELIPMELKIDYTVDDEPQVSSRRHQTPREILTHAGFDAAQYYLKQIKIGQQGDSYKDRPDIPIRLHEHEKFSAIYTGGTPVS